MASQKACLVTGGAGFIGRHLVEQLLADGCRVRVLDIAPGSYFANEVEILQGSIIDEDCVRRALVGIDILYHVAGDPNLWAPNRSHFAEINFHGTETVLQAAARFNLEKIIFTSTESILIGRKPDPGLVIDETIERVPGDMPGPYCRSKFFAEQAAREAAHDGQPVVIVNPTLPIGPGDHKITPPTRMLLGFLNGRHPAYLECLLNINDVRDIARGHILAAEKGRVGERYILGNENIRLSAVLKLLEEITGLEMPKRRIPYWLALGVAFLDENISNWVTRRAPSAPVTGVRLASTEAALDSSKAIKELGIPQRPVIESLRDEVIWLLDAGYARRVMPKLSM